jgi:sirohydrochlorin cobaltochelatase
MKRGLILFAHGARDPRWAEPFEAIAAAVRARAPGLNVKIAFLELMKPDIGSAAQAMAAEGCVRIDVLPLFLGAGGHLRRDLPPLVDALARQHPSIAVTLHPPAGEAPGVIDAMAEHALSLTTTSR